MLIPRKEFAAKCGIKPRELSVYISRGNVLCSKDGKFVDDELPENLEFMAKKKDRDGALDIVIKPKGKKEPTEAQKNRSERLSRISEANYKKRQLETEELEEKITLLRIKKEKQHGFLIPTALVKELFSQQYRSIVITFQQGAEQLILEISKKKRLTREESTRLRKTLLEIINESVSDSIAHSKKSLDDIIDAYSKKLGIGERR